MFLHPVSPLRTHALSVCVCEEGRVEASKALCVPNTAPITHLTHLDSVFLLLFVCFSVTSSSSSYNPPNDLLSLSRQRKTPPQLNSYFFMSCNVWGKSRPIGRDFPGIRLKSGLFGRHFPEMAYLAILKFGTSFFFWFWYFSDLVFFFFSFGFQFRSWSCAVWNCCNRGSLSWSHRVPSAQKHV